MSKNKENWIDNIKLDYVYNDFRNTAYIFRANWDAANALMNADPSDFTSEFGLFLPGGTVIMKKFYEVKYGFSFLNAKPCSTLEYRYAFIIVFSNTFCMKDEKEICDKIERAYEAYMKCKGEDKDNG